MVLFDCLQALADLLLALCIGGDEDGCQRVAVDSLALLTSIFFIKSAEKLCQREKRCSRHARVEPEVRFPQLIHELHPGRILVVAHVVKQMEGFKLLEEDKAESDVSN
jgi:hypothetical protein